MHLQYLFCGAVARTHTCPPTVDPRCICCHRIFDLAKHMARRLPCSCVLCSDCIIRHTDAVCPFSFCNMVAGGPACRHWHSSPGRLLAVCHPNVLLFSTARCPMAEPHPASGYQHVQLPPLLPWTGLQACRGTPGQCVCPPLRPEGPPVEGAGGRALCQLPIW